MADLGLISRLFKPMAESLVDAAVKRGRSKGWSIARQEGFSENIRNSVDLMLQKGLDSQITEIKPGVQRVQFNLPSHLPNDFVLDDFVIKTYPTEEQAGKIVSINNQLYEEGGPVPFMYQDGNRVMIQVRNAPELKLSKHFFYAQGVFESLRDLHEKSRKLRADAPIRRDFIESFKESLKPTEEFLELYTRLIGKSLNDYASRSENRTMIHGDMHLGNAAREHGFSSDIVFFDPFFVDSIPQEDLARLCTELEHRNKAKTGRDYNEDNVIDTYLKRSERPVTADEAMKFKEMYPLAKLHIGLMALAYHTGVQERDPRPRNLASLNTHYKDMDKLIDQVFEEKDAEELKTHIEQYKKSHNFQPRVSSPIYLRGDPLRSDSNTA